MPVLSVLLPVRDAAPWLNASLRSLWRQSLRDFEVIAVNDGSADGSGDLLDRAAEREPRLTVLHAPRRGLPAALNLALRRARGRFVARHDADDLSHRRRFEIQLDRLARDRALGVLGTRVRLFPGQAVGGGMRRWIDWHNSLLDHESIAPEVLIDSPLAHGSAMIRRSTLERFGGWNERGWPEDVDLWIRLIEGGVRFAKCPQTLYGWRQHSASATRRDPRYSRERFDDLRLDAIQRRVPPETRRVTVVGVGLSHERWRRRLLGRGRAVISLRQGRPYPEFCATLEPPVVLVMGSAVARARWRHFLVPRFEETRDFWFVA